MKHEGYDKHSGTGFGKEVKKSGHGKGGWGNEDYDKVSKHHSTQEANELLNEEAEPAQEVEAQVAEQAAEETTEEHKEVHHEFKMKEEDFPSLS